MKINQRVLHIPPYISCKWSEIASIGVETIEGKDLLHVQLLSGAKATVLNLTKDEIDLIFKMHIHHLEEVADEEEKFKNVKEIPFFSNPDKRMHYCLRNLPYLYFRIHSYLPNTL